MRTAPQQEVTLPQIHTVQDDIAVRGTGIHQRSLILTTPWLGPTQPGFRVWLHHEWLKALFSLLLLQQRSLENNVVRQPGGPAALNIQNFVFHRCSQERLQMIFSYFGEVGALRPERHKVHS